MGAIPEGVIENWELRLMWPYFYPQAPDLGPRDSVATEISYLEKKTN